MDEERHDGWSAVLGTMRSRQACGVIAGGALGALALPAGEGAKNR